MAGAMATSPTHSHKQATSPTKAVAPTQHLLASVNGRNDEVREVICHVNMCVCMFACVHVYLGACMYVCIHVCSRGETIHQNTNVSLYLFYVMMQRYNLFKIGIKGHS